MFKNILKIIELFWRIVAKTAEVLRGLLPSLKKLIVSIVKTVFSGVKTALSGLFLGIVVGVLRSSLVKPYAAKHNHLFFNYISLARLLTLLM